MFQKIQSCIFLKYGSPLYLFLLLFPLHILDAQRIYVVNTSDDTDDGQCDSLHCSLREAIIASNLDRTTSLIHFSIPGIGPHIINPSGHFPEVTDHNTNILGESQSGGPGSIIINLNFRNLGGRPFFRVLGKRFTMRGLSFMQMYFNTAGDHILEFGNTNVAADSGVLYDCAFYNDASLNSTLDNFTLKITYGRDILIKNCIFGSDHARKNLFTSRGMILVGPNLELSKTYIDSCFFVTTSSSIEIRNSRCEISHNLFGALDTNKIISFLDPLHAIILSGNEKCQIFNNFFFGQTVSGIKVTDYSSHCDIFKNRFCNSKLDMEFVGYSKGEFSVSDNYARDGGDFLHVDMQGPFSLFVQNNNLSRYTRMLNVVLDSSVSILRHSANRMTCISQKAIDYITDRISAPSRPNVLSVNRNLIAGRGKPYDSVSVYANPALLCPGKVCHAGFELGRTQVDSTGDWELVVNYPNKHYISAYQFSQSGSSGSNIYSEFSDCYYCKAPIRTDVSISICDGDSVIFKGKKYNSSNPYDSFLIRGDGINICDSIFVVNIHFFQLIRTERLYNLCYNDTLFIGPVKLYSKNLIDSFVLQSSNGCDSLIVVKGKMKGIHLIRFNVCRNDTLNIMGERFHLGRTDGYFLIQGGAVSACDSFLVVQLLPNEEGVGYFEKTICENDTFRIYGMLLHKSDPYKVVRIANGSRNGCDSLVHIRVSIWDASFEIRNHICPSDSLLVGGANGQYFGIRKPSGIHIIKNGSYLGCDSTIKVALTFKIQHVSIFRATITIKDTIKVGNQFFHSSRKSGTVHFKSQDTLACDSLVQIMLTVLPRQVKSIDSSEKKMDELPKDEGIIGNSFEIFKSQIRTDCDYSMNQVYEGDVFHLCINIFPNPAAEQVTIFLQSMFRDSLSVHLTNIYGQVVLLEKLNAGYNSIKLDQLPPGIYSAVIFQEGVRKISKIIALRRP